MRGSNYGYHISVNKSCDVGGKLNEPNTFPHGLTGDVYANILQHELSVLLEDVPLRKRHQTYHYQHVGTPLNSSRVIRLYLNL
jgi:hypothetical protein